MVVIPAGGLFASEGVVAELVEVVLASSTFGGCVLGACNAETETIVRDELIVSETFCWITGAGVKPQ